MSLSLDQAKELVQHQTAVLASDLEPVGVVAQVYVDDRTNLPMWAAVVFDPPSHVETVVPVHDARVDGDDLVLAYARDVVESGPRITAGDELPWVEEERLRQHYGQSVAPEDVGTVQPITDVSG